MKDTIAKSDWLKALACPAMAWYALKLFDVDPAHTYSFTFAEALDAHIVRDVSFIDG